MYCFLRFRPIHLAVALLTTGLVLGAKVQADTLYVANNGNSSLVKIDDKGTVSVVTNYLEGACGAAYDYAGNINVLDLDRGRVFRVTKAGNVSIIGNNLLRPEDLAFNSHGELLAANGDGTIRIFEPNDTNPGIFATGLSRPQGIAIDKNDAVYVSNSGNDTISKVVRTPSGVNVTTYATGLKGPASLAFGPDGDLYAANTGDNSIVKISAKGEVTPVAKNIGTPSQVAFDSHGIMYVLNAAAGTVMTVDKSGNAKVFAQGLSKPYGMAFDHPLNKHAPIAPPEPPPPPKPGLGFALAFSAPAVLILIGGILWLIFRKKDEE